MGFETREISDDLSNNLPSPAGDNPIVSCYQAMERELTGLGSLALTDSLGTDIQLRNYLLQVTKNLPAILISDYVWDTFPIHPESKLFDPNTKFPFAQFLHEFLLNSEKETFVLPVLVKRAHFVGFVLCKNKSGLTLQYLNPTTDNLSRHSNEDAEALGAIKKALSQLNIIINNIIINESSYEDELVGIVILTNVQFIKNNYTAWLSSKNLLQKEEILSDKQQANGCDCAYIIGQSLAEIAQKKELTIKRFDPTNISGYIKPIAMARANFCDPSIMGEEFVQNTVRDQLLCRLGTALTMNEKYAREICTFIEKEEENNHELNSNALFELQTTVMKIKSGVEGFKNAQGALLVDNVINHLSASQILKDVKLTELKNFCEQLLYPSFQEDGDVIFMLNPRLKEIKNEPSDEKSEIKLQAQECQEASTTTEFSLNVSAKDQEIIPQETRGEGDCAFHAIFGTWDPDRKWFSCNNVSERRKRIADAIRNCKKDSALFPLVKSAIENLIMEDKQIDGENIKQAQEKYKNAERKKHKPKVWENFEKVIIRYTYVKQYIEDFIQNYIKNYEVTKGKKINGNNLTELNSNFSSRFHTCLNEDNGVLKDWIIGIPEMHLAYVEYKKTKYKIMAWDEIYDDENIINEYADFLEKIGNWLLPMELHIIAKIFDIRVEYNQDNIESFVYNSEAKAEKIFIHFDGHNHYERMASKKEINQSAQIGLSEIQNQSNQPSIGEITKNNLQDDTEINKKIGEIGYLAKIILANSKPHKNLHGDFSWPNEKDTKNENYIPMLSVITGKNGIGKTALLEIISISFRDQINNRKKYNAEPPTAKLIGKNLCELDPKKLPQVFGFSSDTNNDVSKLTDCSSKAHQESITEQFEDLKKYNLSKRYSKRYELVYKENQDLYKRVIKNCEESPVFSIEKGDFHYKFEEELKKHLENEIGLHISSYGSLNTYPKYLLERVTDVSTLNDYLKEKGFKYILANECLRNEKEFDRLTLKKIGEKETIDHGWLSPGERLELLTLLWLFETKIIKKSEVGSIFILDEFDAHLHPGLAREIIEVIKTKLISEYGIQVIMTTHNPTTVSLVPKNSLYIMSADNNDTKVKIEKAISKKQAVQLLTSDFVYVNEPIRIIFVEADNDKKFYNILQKHLIDSHLIDPEYQLIFESHGRVKIDQIAAEEKAESRSIPEDSSRAQVERLVKKCVSGEDQDKTLRDFIFGLVDGDGKGKSKLLNIEALERYAIENYIYDPIHIFFALKEAKMEVEETFNGLQQVIVQLVQASGLPMPNSFSELLAMQESERNVILQHIIDVFMARFLQELEIMIKDKTNFCVINRLKQDRFKLIDKGKLDTRKKPIEFLDKVKLEYPVIFSKMRGHDIEEVYQKIFSKQKIKLDMQLMINFCAKNMLIPLDLLKTLKNFQNSSAQKYKLIKSKKKDKGSKLSEEIIKDLQDDSKRKDEKIKRQTEEMKKLNESIPKLKEKLAKTRTVWSTQNNLHQYQLLKTEGIFSSKKKKAFECEDITSIIDTKPLEYKK